MKISMSKLLRIVLILFVALSAILSINIFHNDSVMHACILILAVILVFEARYNVNVFIIACLLAYFSYSFVQLRYLNPDSISVNSLIEYGSGDVQAQINILVFLAIVAIVIIFNKQSGREKKTTQIVLYGKQSNVLATTMLILLPIIWVISYNFSFGERSGYSAIYEYAVVLFIFGIYFSGKNKVLRGLFIAVAVFYVLFDFLGGQRSTGVQIVLVVVLMCFAKYLSIKRILICAVIGVFAVSFLALFRGSFSLSSISFSDVLGYLGSTGFAASTAGFAYQTSLTFIGSMQYYSIGERLIQFGQFLINQVIVGEYGESLIQIAAKHYTHYNGGVLPIYLYYYLGWLGTAISGILVGIYVKFISGIYSDELSDLKKIISIYVVASTHRWFLYSPFPLIRGVLLISLLYGLSSLLTVKTKRMDNLECENRGKVL